MARELPFFSFGNEARGVIAIGNTARGVIAIGGSISVGVVSIGTNAIGVIAIGLNAAGAISLALINGAGVLSWAGVNVIGGVGGSFVNAGIAPWLGVVLAAIGLVIGELIHVPRSRPRIDPAVSGGWLGHLLEAEPGVYRVAARLERRDRTLVLSDGAIQLEAEAGRALQPRGDRRVLCDVRVVDELHHRGGYRDAANRRRRLVVESVEPVPRPAEFLHSRDDLTWLISRSLQAVSAVTGAVCLVLAMAG